MLSPTAIALHPARSPYLGRSDRRLAYELDLRTFEVLAPVEEPLDGADDEDDEEGDDAVI